MLRILNVVGARPNFIKIAPLLKAMAAHPDRLEPILVNTGQHYDPAMVDYFFDDLEIPSPDVNLGVGSGSHAEQTARVMMAFEPVCLKYQPHLVLLVGDVNSTVACSLVAAKLGIRIAHVEAGLRSFDRTMPEEVNREVTDLLSDLLFTTCEDGNVNLRRAGIPGDRVFFVGNVMIDSLLTHLPMARQRPILKERRLKAGEYGLITLHRPSNVDDPAVLSRLLDAFEAIQKRLKLVFPAHPRTLKSLGRFNLGERLETMDNLLILPPQGYLDFMALTAGAKLTLTDSGGLQEETTILKVPCLTLRENTERPITITQGTNTLVGTQTGRIVEAAYGILDGKRPGGAVPPLWDGQASQRVVEVLLREFEVARELQKHLQISA
ncbi:MAG: UDP-N-acetylglucosamine 2-epimerase (non-hydrolyzing) [Candidatus Zixiibacteriota bacterium]|nr:MAG: UDP-N-acetylglucosamine 2-epimerase (non-hydrolyzing) [candidate division Zixibacteria bacterium]